MTGQEKDKEGRARTFGQYDMIGNDDNLVHLVTHGPIIEDFCYVGWKTEPTVPAWLCETLV